MPAPALDSSWKSVLRRPPQAHPSVPSQALETAPLSILPSHLRVQWFATGLPGGLGLILDPSLASDHYRRCGGGSQFACPGAGFRSLFCLLLVISRGLCFHFSLVMSLLHASHVSYLLLDCEFLTTDTPIPTIQSTATEPTCPAATWT